MEFRPDGKQVIDGLPNEGTVLDVFAGVLATGNLLGDAPPPCWAKVISADFAQRGVIDEPIGQAVKGVWREHRQGIVVWHGYRRRSGVGRFDLGVGDSLGHATGLLRRFLPVRGCLAGRVVCVVNGDLPLLMLATTAL